MRVHTQATPHEVGTTTEPRAAGLRLHCPEVSHSEIVFSDCKHFRNWDCAPTSHVFPPVTGTQAWAVGCEPHGAGTPEGTLSTSVLSAGTMLLTAATGV